MPALHFPRETKMVKVENAFAAFFKDLQSRIGMRLCTVTQRDVQAGLARRCYSSHPIDYPVTGTKPLRDDAWTDLVFGQKRPFIANTTPEFAIYFSDHALINQLGCQSAMNLPVLGMDGEVVGTLNMLDIEGKFTPEVVRQIEALAQIHRPALIAELSGTPMPK